jgi:hypothetical protein
LYSSRLPDRYWPGCDSPLVIAMAVPTNGIHISLEFTVIIEKTVLAVCNKAAAYV